MKALQYHSKEKPLILDDLPDPPTSSDRILYEVLASALNHRDVWICQGLYPGIQPKVTLGSDGVVKHNGQHYMINPGLDWGSDPHLPSDSYTILGMPADGTFAEKIALSQEQLFQTPGHLSVFEAAALPLAGLTAYRLLFIRCQLQASDRVCVTGIGGGVALTALQFAVATGCEVWVTSSSINKIKKAVTLGAAGGQLYTEDQWHKKLLKDSGGFDVIIDSAAGDGFSHLIAMANKGARIGIYGGSKGNISNLSPQRIFWKHLTIFGSSMGNASDFRNMVDFVDQNRIVPVVDSIFKLSDFETAFQRMRMGEQFGKIVFDHKK
ncbi:MAG: zinc-binding dehydrogenase [Saprospiraceae bacterium]|nr:zinc-binding dehydrogenase [Saprospiraceae bacterium]